MYVVELVLANVKANRISIIKLENAYFSQPLSTTATTCTMYKKIVYVLYCDEQLRKSNLVIA